MGESNTIVEILLVLSTIAIAIVTWMRMGESNSLLRKDLDVKIRPVLARTVIGDSIRKAPDGSIIHEPVYSLQPDKVLFHFTNSGTLPAKKIKQTSFISLKPKDTHEKIYALEGKELPDLAPNEKYSIDIFYEKLHYTQALAFNICHFGLNLEYEDPNGNGYFYHMQGHFEKGYLMLDSVEMN
ncbi:MAG: hypothetical protein KGI10_03945 [Thaumarchaeota archaeon]|nr:hypothetical protein [Nitrososphaerota archaeon]